MSPILPAILAATLLAIPAQADSYRPAPSDRVMISQGGLALASPDATARAALPLGSPFHDSLRQLVTVMGPDFTVYLPEECPAGPVVVVSFPDRIDLIYQQDQLAGWMLRPGSDLTTAGGIGLGAPLAALGGLTALDIFESTLGWEFQAGSLSGLLSDREGIVEHLWSGTVCIFR